MDSQLITALKLKMQPVAIILTNDKPAEGLHLKEGSMGGCVAAFLVAASRKGRLAYFNRKTFGCPGGGTGLGFGDRYRKFPIDCLLSTGNKEMAAQMGRGGSSMAEGERFYKKSVSGNGSLRGRQLPGYACLAKVTGAPIVNGLILSRLELNAE